MNRLTGIVGLVSGLFIVSGCGGVASLSQPPNSQETAAAVAAGSPVSISAILGERNSANGIDVSITWKNLSAEKTIKYCWFVAEFANSVGDVVTSTIGDKKEVNLEATGPYKPGKTTWGGLHGWSAAFYHPNASTVRLKSVQCEYMENGEKTDVVKLAGVIGASGEVIEKMR